MFACFYLLACSNSGGSTAVDPSNKDSVHNPIDSTNDSTDVLPKLIVFGISSSLESDQYVSVAGKGFDTSLRVYFGNAMVPIDTLRETTCTFHAPWPRGTYPVLITNRHDSLRYEVTIVRPDQAKVVIKDGWYSGSVMVLDRSASFYTWKSNADGSMRQEPSRMTIDQSESIPWIKISHDTIIGGNPYDHNFTGLFDRGNTLVHFGSDRFLQHEESGGPGKGTVKVSSHYRLYAKDLDVRMEGSTIVATGLGSFCGVFEEESSSSVWNSLTRRTSDHSSKITIKFTPSN